MVGGVRLGCEFRGMKMISQQTSSAKAGLFMRHASDTRGETGV